MADEIKPLPERVAILETKVAEHETKLALGATRMNERDQAVKDLRQDTMGWVDRALSENKQSNDRVEKALEVHTSEDKAMQVALLAEFKERRNGLRNLVLSSLLILAGAAGSLVWFVARQPGPDAMQKANESIEAIKVQQAELVGTVKAQTDSAARTEDAIHQVEAAINRQKDGTP